MKFQDKIREHLSEYKTKSFPGSPNGKWNGEEYSHVLDEADKYNNVLEPYRKLFFESKFKNVDLHPYFHHLNSSQAMCINFFFPLYASQELGIVLDCLGMSNEKVDYNTVEFSKTGMDFSEGKGITPTYFDLFFKTQSGKNIYFEVKYSELVFGKAKHDKSHTDKYNNVYSKLLEPIMKDYKNEEAFLNNYQMMRKLVHLQDLNTYIVFIYPSQNTSISKGIEEAKNMLLRFEYANNFLMAPWENLVEKTMHVLKVGSLHNYYEKFNDKYFMDLE